MAEFPRIFPEVDKDEAQARADGRLKAAKLKPLHRILFELFVFFVFSNMKKSLSKPRLLCTLHFFGCKNILLFSGFIPTWIDTSSFGASPTPYWMLLSCLSLQMVVADSKISMLF